VSTRIFTPQCALRHIKTRIGLVYDLVIEETPPAALTYFTDLICCSKYDLYTKSTKIPDIEALKPYYQTLIDKYLPGVVSF